MHMIEVAGYPVHVFQNCRGQYQWEPLGTGELWPGSEEYPSPQEAERAAQLWGEDVVSGAGEAW